MQALQIFAGPRARAHLRERGLAAADVRVIPAAAGGPKGLVLNPLDRFIFSHWLAAAPQSVHLILASISAWRMASACLPEADAALAQLVDDYIAQDYAHAPGKAAHQGRRVRDLRRQAAAALRWPRRRGAGPPALPPACADQPRAHLLRREGRVRTAGK